MTRSTLLGGETLKPCPFCGSPATLAGKATVMVRCTECSAATFQQLRDETSAITHWNRREADKYGEREG